MLMIKLYEYGFHSSAGTVSFLREQWLNFAEIGEVRTIHDPPEITLASTVSSNKMTESLALGPDQHLHLTTAPATLEKFALTSIALTICSCKRYLQTEDELNQPDIKCYKVIYDYVPKVIKRLIKARVKSVDIELQSAFVYLIYFEISNLTSARYSRIYQCFTYGADAAFSYEATAKNLINFRGLTLEEKYMVACRCCFEDDVRRLWPYVSCNPAFDAKKFPLNKYWAGRMNYRSNGVLTHRGMVEHLRYEGGSWSALTYMWSKSTRQEQQSDIDWFFKETQFWLPNVDKLLTKLTSEQLNYIMTKYVNDMIIEFSYHEWSVEICYWLWNHYKAIISDEQFCKLVKRLFGEEFQCPRRVMRFRQSIPWVSWVCNENHAHPRVVLYEIWARAPLGLKSAFISSDLKVEILFDDVNILDEEKTISCHNLDVKFFYSFLADLDFERRNAIWLKYWPVIVNRVRVQNLDPLLKLCLRKENVDQFVMSELTSLHKIAKLLNRLFAQEKYDDLIEFTSMCTCKMNEANGREFRRKLIEFYATLLQTRTDHLELYQIFYLTNFVNRLSVFPDEPNQLMELIFVSNGFQNLAARTDSYLKASEVTPWNEHLILYHWPRYLINPHTNENAELSEERWAEFWSWCEDIRNGGGVSRFMVHLRIDEIGVDYGTSSRPNLDLF